MAHSCLGIRFQVGTQPVNAEDLVLHDTHAAFVMRTHVWPKFGAMALNETPVRLFTSKGWWNAVAAHVSLINQARFSCVTIDNEVYLTDRDQKRYARIRAAAILTMSPLANDGCMLRVATTQAHLQQLYIYGCPTCAEALGQGALACRDQIRDQYCR